MQYAQQIARADGLSEQKFLATLNCEGGFAYDAVGDDGISIGVAQINLQAHPEVFYVQAMDPQWSIKWMANEWIAGNARLWTCWRERS